MKELTNYGVSVSFLLWPFREWVLGSFLLWEDLEERNSYKEKLIDLTPEEEEEVKEAITEMLHHIEMFRNPLKDKEDI